MFIDPFLPHIPPTRVIRPIYRLSTLQQNLNMKFRALFILLVCCLSFQLTGQDEHKIIVEVERFLLNDNPRTPASQAANSLCHTLSKKLNISTPHPTVVNAISTLISNFRSQKVAKDAGQYKVVLFGDLIGQLVFSVQSIKKMDSKDCAKAKKEMLEELDRFIEFLGFYMNCIAEYSGWKYPKLRSQSGPFGAPRPPGYEESNDPTEGPGPFNPIPAPHPPEGDEEPLSPQHPCTRQKENLERFRSLFNRAAQEMQEVCG